MTPDLKTGTIHEMGALQHFFSTAMEKLKQGQVVDMTGIDVRVSQLCQVVQKAPPEDQQMFLPELTVLIDLLNNYEALLRKLQASAAAAAENRKDDGQS